MPILPRPVSPRSALADLTDYLLASRAHKWPLMALSATLTWLLIWVFIVDANTNTAPKRNQIQYIQNWQPSRGDVEIILQQKRELARNEELLREKQKKMQKVADMFGVEWRKDEKRLTEQRAEALRYINARLDERLARARAMEAAQTPSPAKPQQP